MEVLQLLTDRITAKNLRTVWKLNGLLSEGLLHISDYLLPNLNSIPEL